MAFADECSLIRIKPTCTYPFRRRLQILSTTISEFKSSPRTAANGLGLLTMIAVCSSLEQRAQRFAESAIAVRYSVTEQFDSDESNRLQCGDDLGEFAIKWKNP